MSGAIESQTSPTDIINVAQQDEISVLKEQLAKLESKTNDIEKGIDKLKDIFLVWQDTLDIVLDSANKAISNSNLYLMLISGGIVLASGVATLWYYLHLKNSTIKASSEAANQAANQALERFDESLAKGLLPEESAVTEKFVGVILNSHKFKEEWQKNYNKHRKEEADEMKEVLQVFKRLANEPRDD